MSKKVLISILAALTTISLAFVIFVYPHRYITYRADPHEYFTFQIYEQGTMTFCSGTEYQYNGESVKVFCKDKWVVATPDYDTTVKIREYDLDHMPYAE